MDKICQHCKHWKPLVVVIRGQTQNTDEMFCEKSDDAGSTVYGQDGKAIITEASFGCNRWEPII